MGEFNIYGVYVPAFLIQAILAYLVFKVVVIGLDRLTEKNWIIFPAIFNLCVYLILLCGMHWLFIGLGL
ncbi:DUF1656 domain-containing protein [uncultured Acinetobacter sp.]|uniref:DUF1656 domain-containing protein n=1 Tax=uncultured Acinetobacter sp. TaxID=165433 RepID=UPI0025D05F78|nr:DUF1656 domain-containing protein [uncultured Acinetobacter sp.]